MTQRGWKIWSWICLGAFTVCLSLTVTCASTGGGVFATVLLAVSTLAFGAIVFLCDQQTRRNNGPNT